nr:hypothetical protein [Thermoanaerobaculia bacterium]
MKLAPEFLADLLTRRNRITPDQAFEIKKEAKLLPGRSRTARAYEQNAIAYELVQGLRLPLKGRPGSFVNEIEIGQAIAEDAGLEFLRIDTLNLDADLIESRMSRPFARRHRMIPLDLVNGRLRVAC